MKRINGSRQKANAGAVRGVALGGEVVEEALTLPFVHYPSTYGTFFGFSRAVGAPVVLCSCSRGAVENYACLRDTVAGPKYVDPLRNAPLDGYVFPPFLSRRSLESGTLDWLAFERGVCHRCQGATPRLSWCHEMYGGQFQQSFGWYVHQVAFRMGVSPYTYDFIPDRCPEELINQVLEYREAQAERNRLGDRLAGGSLPGSPVLAPTTPEEQRRVRALERKVRQMRRRLTKRFENLAREEFGFRPVGEAWVSESLLAKIIGRLLPGKELRRNERPAWLLGLELDVFVPELKLGIEYQGKQHFEAIPAWGGEGALVEVQHRDAKKRLLCEQHGVMLVHIDFTEPLTEEHVANRLREALGPAYAGL